LSGPTSLLRRVSEVSADLGWRRALSLAPRWLVRRRYLALECGLDFPNPGSVRPDELRVTPLGDADWPALGRLDPAMTRDEVRRRHEEGQECLLGWWGEELAHYRWESTKPVYLPYLGRVLRPLPGDQIVGGIYTSPRYRGHGIASVVMREGIVRARARGVGRLVWLAAWWNTRSLGLAEQMASRVVGTVEHWTLGGLRRYVVTGGVRIEPDGAVVVTSYSPETSRRSRWHADRSLHPR
jgi:GNAT superfamily N-acetyltransferase